MGNSNMHAAKRNKNDEFYTRLEDIEKELNNYKTQFRGKTIYCNCDTLESNFWRYFYNNYPELELKGLIASHIDYEEGAYSYEYDGKSINKKQLGSGDFRSNECIELLKQADIVVTNPPFSLFREYVAQLMEHEKQFLTIGNFNAITYKEIFPLIKNESIWLGYTSPKEFIQPEGSTKKFGNITWFTNLDVKRRKEPMKLYHSYYGNEDRYPKYDNYDAINVDRVNNIPKDYEGVMGVPITFLTKHTPVQFEILGIACGNSWVNYRKILESLSFDPTITYGGGLGSGIVKGKAKYARILIRNKNPEVETNKKGE